MLNPGNFATAATEEEQMAEKRKFPRRDLIFYSRVSDGISGRALGYLLNIPPEGAMILSEKPLEADLEVELHIELPDELSNLREMVIPARSRWCQPDINPEFYDVGFVFLKMTEEYTGLILRLVEEYGFR
jgi:hypothetical protein